LTSVKTFPVVVPRTNANDDNAILQHWLKQAGEPVRAGELIAQIETTKAAVDIEAHSNGYLHPVAASGAMVAVGDPIAWILDPYEPAAIGSASVQSSAENASGRNRPISRKAAEMIATAGLSIADFPGDGPIRGADVRQLAAGSRGTGAKAELLSALIVTDASVALFGASDQGVVVADCLKAVGVHVPCCFIDDAPPAANLEGLPIFESSLLKDLIARGLRFAHVCIGDPKAKLRVARRLKDDGFTIVAAVHPKAMISPSARLGEGVYVGPGVVIGPDAVVGDYSQINNNATVAHHARTGMAVRVSDGAHIAGGVRIGDRSYLGLGVTVNTDCHIGSDVTIVSGVSIFDAVADRAVIRAGTMRR
jgi:sugar O-acyltransferase (sialic acid O-acetyltransferase NeuD family)